MIIAAEDEGIFKCLGVGQIGGRTRQTVRKKDFGDAAASKVHFLEAERLYSLGMFQDSIAEYEQAFSEQPFPEFIFNIAQCYRQLGSYQKALFFYRRFLELQPDAANRADVLDLIAKLEAETPMEPRRPRLIRASMGVGAIGLAIAGVGIAIGMSRRSRA